ncbi:ABC transporter ATP-binding protein [Ectopseudomonas mendocina]|uniref:ABC transporter ATP-binding protein n=1 Tax=Ectopseudomonas mendocina TaxID=300 RepID=A0ABZ2RKC2_ECTME
MDLIQVENLTVGTRLNSISFTVKRGDMLGVIGPNGAGKSTLLRCLAGIQPYSGRIEYECRDLSELNQRQRARLFGYLPQAQHSAWALRVEDVVALGRLPWGDEDRQKIEAAMRLTDVDQWRKRSVAQLSGGEQARVWLARVLAGEPNVLLADEPIASLDLKHQRTIMELLRGHSNWQQATILSLHDLSLAARYCDKLCLMAEGNLLAFGTPEDVLTPQHLSLAFGVDVYVDLNSQPPIILPR